IGNATEHVHALHGLTGDLAAACSCDRAGTGPWRGSRGAGDTGGEAQQRAVAQEITPGRRLWTTAHRLASGVCAAIHANASCGHTAVVRPAVPRVPKPCPPRGNKDRKSVVEGKSGDRGGRGVNKETR